MMGLLELLPERKKASRDEKIITEALCSCRYEFSGNVKRYLTPDCSPGVEQFGEGAMLVMRLRLSGYARLLE